ncbi:MAG: hypothetical protein U0457_17545 [Candidatus Sericytochromatia bacterium]
MNHYDPQVGKEFPQEYIDFNNTLESDIIIGKAIIYKWGKNPDILGRPGTENFWKSLLIGSMQGGQQITLTYDYNYTTGKGEWFYQITRYAEWAIDEIFDDYADLREFLKTYKGIDL